MIFEYSRLRIDFMILSVENIYKYYNGEPLLKDVCFSVEEGERIGIVGVNGCGKSTLLRIVSGEEDFDRTPDGRGSVSLAGGKRIGVLKQTGGLESGCTIAEEMRKPFESLIAIRDRMTALEHSMTSLSGADLETAGEEYSELSAYFEARDGYRIDVAINTVLGGMGFGGVPTDRKISSLSGGEKTRLALSKLLLEAPELLILDEPTNHLDAQTVVWLEDYLKGYKGAVMVVSHDRYFLDRLVGRIFEIRKGVLTAYKGNYTAFAAQKKMNIARQSKEYEQQQKEIARLEQFVAAHKVRATSAKAAKNKQHAIDRMELVEKPDDSIAQAHILLEYDIVPPKELLSVEGCELAVGSGEKHKLLCPEVSFSIRRGEKVAFVGSNGAGKTSLLRLLQGVLPHERGFIKWAANVKIAYFEQEHGNLHPKLSAFEEIRNRYPNMSELMVRKSLAAVLLTGEDVFKPIEVLSGGEKAKLCFCLMSLQRGNVLILDEPTNHLDITSMEALEDAVSAFDGTVIMVSHDRYLLSKLATRIIEIEGGALESFDGGYEMYAAVKAQRAEEEQRRRQEEKDAVRAAAEQKNYRSKAQRAQEARKRQMLADVEKQIGELEDRLDKLERVLSGGEYAGDFEKVSAVCAEMESLKLEIDEKMELWAQLGE